MIIIDPDRNGATIYRNEFVSYITGSVREVCNQIIKRTCSRVDTCGLYKQILPIGVVDHGIGMAYIHELEYRGLDVKHISSKAIDILLPEITE